VSFSDGGIEGVEVGGGDGGTTSAVGGQRAGARPTGQRSSGGRWGARSGGARQWRQRSSPGDLAGEEAGPVTRSP
jgi:hypothetical protein